jgi:hypothetical protein
MLHALCGLLALVITPQAADHADHREALTQGVDSLVAPGAAPGAMVAQGGRSFVVLTGRANRERAPLAVAAIAGEGRVVAVGHEAFFGEKPLEHGGNKRFLENALTWLGRKPLEAVRVGAIGMGGIRPATPAQVTDLTSANVAQNLGSIDVLCMTQGALDGNAAAQDAVRQFVERGGGLLIAGPAWGWQMLSPSKNLATDHTGNRILARFGLGFADGIVDGPFTPESADEPLLTTQAALQALTRAHLEAAHARLATATIERALGLGHEGVEARVRELAKTSPNHVPTAKTPISTATPAARLALLLDAPSLARLHSEAIPAHPAAEAFPGPVAPGAPRVSRTLTVHIGTHGWHGLDLYAPPGEVITITLPEAATGHGFEVRIGAHSDRIWHLDKWERYPEISHTAPLDEEVTRVSSPFGGLIYIVAPSGQPRTLSSVIVSGATPAAVYRRGQTTREQWASMLEQTGAPWGELYGNWIALTLPTSVLRKVEDPEALAEYWDEVAELCYQLYAAPKRPRQERFVPDIQISAGYMHAGYPIMTHMDVAETFADLTKLRAKGGPIWGFYHELGHNYQEPAWTWDGTGEVTNNLFSLYGAEKLNGVTPDTYGLAHPAMEKKTRQDRLRKHLAAGAPYEAWKQDPFLALTMYVHLREAFGWEPFTKVFAEYRDTPRDQLPRNDLEKRDQWMVRMSRAVGRNLGPFFQAWGVPTSEAARQSIGDLPGWMPADWPGQ